MEKKRYESQRQASNRWNRDNTKNISVKFFLKTESDLLDYLAAQPNRNGYIKSLIRQDMENNPAADQEPEDPQ